MNNQVIHTFNIKLWYISFDDVISLQSWVLAVAVSKDNYFLKINEGQENEGSDTESDSKV